MINFENLIVGIMLLTSILLIAYAFLKKDTDEKIGLICAGLLLGVFGVGSANGIKAENKTPKYIHKTIILNQKIPYTNKYIVVNNQENNNNSYNSKNKSIRYISKEGKDITKKLSNNCKIYWKINKKYEDNKVKLTLAKNDKNQYKKIEKVTIYLNDLN